MAAVDTPSNDTSCVPHNTTRHLTLTLSWSNDATYRFINALRTGHYPPALLFNPAHVGIFTRVAVPDTLLSRVQADLAEIASRTAPFVFKVQSYVQTWNKNVVLRVQEKKLYALRSALNRRWLPLEIVDKQERGEASYQPHVSVHGRVSKDAAQAVHGKVAASVSRFTGKHGPMRGRAVGICLWEYKEGQSWTPVATYPFETRGRG